MLECFEVTQTEETVADVRADLGQTAGADSEPAEVWVAYRMVIAQVACAVTERAVRVAQHVVWRIRGRRSRLSRPRDSAGEPSQCLLDFLGHPCPRLAIP